MKSLCTTKTSFTGLYGTHKMCKWDHSNIKIAVLVSLYDFQETNVTATCSIQCWYGMV